MSVKLNLLKNTGAGVLSKMSVLLFRLLQVPMLLTAFGTEDLGRWFILSTFPTWLMLTNLGFGYVSSNEMSMSIASNDLSKAKSIYSTTLLLVALISIIGLILISIIVPNTPIERFLQLPEERHTELVLTIFWFAISVFLTFIGDVISARFRAARKAHLGSVFYSLLPWLDLLAIFIVLKFSIRFDHIALGLLFSNLIYIILVSLYSHRIIPELSFSFKDVKTLHFKFLFRKGFAFLAFPLGNVMLFQGNLLIVESILGPTAVALFATARTLVRLVNQGLELINQVTWPEFSHLLGSNDLKRAARLHRAGVGLSILVSGIGILILVVFGQTLYQLWVGHSMKLSTDLLFLFLLPIIFNALWFTSSVVHAACNQHEGLAIRYLIASSVSVMISIALTKIYGIEGAALSTIVVDIILIPYVLKRSILLTGDTWKKFFKGMFKEMRALPFLLKRIYN